ncbi:hypothetical protein ACO0RG_002987 [Hanseniaspora osmophila]
MQFRNFKFCSKSYTTTSTSTATAHVNVATGSKSTNTTTGCNTGSSTTSTASRHLIDNKSDFFESNTTTKKTNNSFNNTRQNKNPYGRRNNSNNKKNNNLISFTSNLHPSAHQVLNPSIRSNSYQSVKRCPAFHRSFRFGRGRHRNFRNNFYSNYNYKYCYEDTQDNGNNNKNTNNKTSNAYNNNRSTYSANSSSSFRGLNAVGANINYKNIDQQLDINNYNCKIIHRRNSIDIMNDIAQNTCGLNTKLDSSIGNRMNNASELISGNNTDTTTTATTTTTPGNSLKSTRMGVSNSQLTSTSSLFPMTLSESSTANSVDVNQQRIPNTDNKPKFRPRSQSINTGSIAYNINTKQKHLPILSQHNHELLNVDPNVYLGHFLNNNFSLNASKRYLSTMGRKDGIVKSYDNEFLLKNKTADEPHIINIIDSGDLVSQQKKQPSNLVLDHQVPNTSKTSPWPLDTDDTLNKEKFLDQNIKEIDLCFTEGKFNKINSLYMALKRNDIVPPLPVFEKIIASLCLRDLDSQNLDERMFNLLNCYQDLINSKKYHPSSMIYDHVIATLLEGSIAAKKLNNYNGMDFFKIAIELFKTVQKQSLSNPSQTLLTNLLVSVNLYPGYISFNELYAKVAPLVSSKDHLYYITLLKYCRDPAIIDSLIDEYNNFNLNSSATSSDDSNKYKVLSIAIESLMKTNNLTKASKILDETIMEIKNLNGQSANIQLLLSKYLISLSASKDNYKKAYKMWYKFSKLSWIPPFTYDFYLQFLSNVLNNNDWDLACRLYYYMYTTTNEASEYQSDSTLKNAESKTGNTFAGSFALTSNSFKKTSQMMEDEMVDVLLHPSNVDSLHSHFLNMALKKKSSKLILTILEESMLKNYKFDLPLYNKIFEHLKNYSKTHQDYLMRFVECHGSLLESTSNYEKFEFLNSIVKNYQNQTLLNDISKMKFFMKYCQNFKVINNFNYTGLIAIFENSWKSPQSIMLSSYNLELHAYIVSEFYNLDYHFENPAMMAQINSSNKVLAQFKEDATNKFKRLIINYKRLNLDPSALSERVVHLATRILDIPEVDASDFVLRGDWDKTYPVHLGSKIRNATKQGLKDYQVLQRKGYCFDWDTYYTLMTKNVIDANIVTKLITEAPTFQQLHDSMNIMISLINPVNLNNYVFQHELFTTKILPNLNDKSLSKIVKVVPDLNKFLENIDFATHFKPIKQQIDFENFISMIYTRLFQEKRYNKILIMNKKVPVLNLSILLKCYLRLGDIALFEKYLAKWGQKLSTNELNDIKAEHLVNQGKYDEALEILQNSSSSTPHKTNDLKTFIYFVKDCVLGKTESQMVCKIDFAMENTLQLANVLSTCNSFQEMKIIYNEFLGNSEAREFKGAQNFVIVSLEAKLEILDQMLNNFESVLQLQPESPVVRESVSHKLSKYFAFKNFLQLPQIGATEMMKIMDIWSHVSPKNLDFVFNNIAETLYYDKYCDEIIIKGDCLLSADTETLQSVFGKLIEFFQASNQSEKVGKVETLQKLLEH